MTKKMTESEADVIDGHAERMEEAAAKLLTLANWLREVARGKPYDPIEEGQQ